jgi:EmrB/QacA subfamily drug resistance transporter
MGSSFHHCSALRTETNIEPHPCIIFNLTMSKPRSPFYVTSLIAGAFFMENLDGTIIATALPQMAKSFHVGAVNLNIGMTAYLITLAVFIPISGWVADRFGARTVFASAVGIFTLASLLCAGAHTLTQFTLMRILQGIGGAMMVPVGRLIVLRSTPKDQLTQAIAYISWPGLTALVLGPPIGGFITTYFSWHWIFLLNLPIGLVALILTTLWIENEQTNPNDHHSFDWLTFLFAGLASTGIVFALEKLGGGGTWQLPFAILAISLISGAVAVAIARRNPTTSLIDLQSLQLKSYSLSIYGASLFRISVGVLPFLLPLMFQEAFGLSAFASGLYLFALFGGDLSMKAIVIPVLRRWGFRKILIVNGVLTAASIALCAALNPGTPPALIAAILFLHGSCRSLEFTCMTTLAYTEIPSERMSRANGFLSAVMQLSMGMGVAVGAVTLRVVAQANGHATSAPQLVDFHIAIFVIALLALAPVFDALGLAPNAGASTSGHQPQELLSPAE